MIPYVPVRDEVELLGVKFFVIIFGERGDERSRLDGVIEARNGVTFQDGGDVGEVVHVEEKEVETEFQ